MTSIACPSAILKTTIPQRRPAGRGDARRLCLCPDVLQYLPNVGAVGDERNDSHLLATQGAQQREHLADAGDQHRPKAVRRALGWHQLGRLVLISQYCADFSSAGARSKTTPKGRFLFQAAVTTQAVVSLAFPKYSSIWSKFRYL